MSICNRQNTVQHMTHALNIIISTKIVVTLQIKYICVIQDFFYLARKPPPHPPVNHGLLILEFFYITLNDASQSVGLLWTSDQLVAETFT